MQNSIISSKPITTETPKISEVIQLNTNGSFQEDISANAIGNNSVGVIGFITTLGVSVAGDKISNAISASVNGTVYKYGLIAKDVPSSRTRSYEGARIVATTWDNLSHKPITKTYYDGYYPEFITKQDISVAYAIYSDFWLDSMDVYSWNPY
jgi:hypothetical protein